MRVCARLDVISKVKTGRSSRAVIPLFISEYFDVLWMIIVRKKARQLKLLLGPLS